MIICKPMSILFIQNCFSESELSFYTIYILDFALLCFLYNILLIKTLLLWLCNFPLNAILLLHVIFFFEIIFYEK